MKAFTAVILVLTIVFQTGCQSRYPLPRPIRPGDPDQKRAIERADRVDVVTVDGSTYRLTDAVLDPPYLRGEEPAVYPARPERRAIPLDSIAEIQLVSNRAAGIWVASAVLLILASGLVAGDMFEGRAGER